MNAGNSSTPIARQLVGDRAEKTFRIAALHARQQQQRFPIRPQIEEILRRDLAGHHRVASLSRLAKELEQPSQLTDAQPFDLVDGSANSGRVSPVNAAATIIFHARLARRLREQQRISAVPGDDSECFRRSHKFGERRRRNFVSAGAGV